MMELLNKPLIICGKEIKNRVVVPAMSDFGTVAPDGFIRQSHIDRYGAYAKGGAGLIIIEACSVVQMPENRDTVVLEHDGCIPGMKRLADVIHQYQAISLVQIMLTGLSTMQENRIAEISREDFLRYRAAFISAAVRCQKAGFDGVELHAAHGMYLNQVIEAGDRSDEYGGRFENRIRLLSELIQEIKKCCGSQFIVAVRFGNADIKELLHTAQAIEQSGGDLLDVSTGMGRYTAPADFPFDSKIYAASLVKKEARIPVIGVGNIATGQQAEKILAASYSDLIAVGRGHLCDPVWAQKVFSGKDPIPCRHCTHCLWYVDGRKCPARLERR